MIKLTDIASKKIISIIENREDKDEIRGLRVGVRGGGCSGFSYFLKFDSNISELDRTIVFEQVKLIIDNKSYLYLMGTEIDYIDDLNSAGFKFNNPNAKRTCGCGESFSM
jgi:iron-sulfur cluster assembly protein